MQYKGALWAAAAALVSVAVACGGYNKNPTSPTGAVGSATGAGVDAAADGSTLKVPAPVLISPIGGVRLTDPEATVTFQVTRGTFAPNQVYQYHVQLQNANGVPLEDRVINGTTLKLTTVFDADTLYRWRVRPEIEDTFGPWSIVESFRSIEKVEGYIKGNELYDPLLEGKTVGTINGPVTFIPGVGVRLDSRRSYIEYFLPETLTGGEYSALLTNLEVISSNEDPKDRVISMRSGQAAINDNLYRMTVDKRGNGAVAWRFITGPGDYIETVGQERQVVSFHEALTYFVRASWRNNFFNVIYREGGIDGKVVYDGGKGYSREYKPRPHMVYAGSPYQPGDRGEASTVEDMIIRQIWVSANPRPPYANK